MGPRNRDITQRNNIHASEGREVAHRWPSCDSAVGERDMFGSSWWRKLVLRSCPVRLWNQRLTVHVCFLADGLGTGLLFLKLSFRYGMIHMILPSAPNGSVLGSMGTLVLPHRSMLQNSERPWTRLSAMAKELSSFEHEQKPLREFVGRPEDACMLVTRSWRWFEMWNKASQTNRLGISRDHSK